MHIREFPQNRRAILEKSIAFTACAALAMVSIGSADDAWAAYFRRTYVWFKPVDTLTVRTIPKAWKELSIEKTFRGKKLSIRIETPDGKESGASALYVNGEKVFGNYVPESMMTQETEIRLVL